MAIDSYYLRVLSSLIASVFPDAQSNAARRAIGLSYPDLLVSQPHLIKILGEPMVAKLRVHANDASIRQWHQLGPEFGTIYETTSLFEAWGFPIDFIDIKKHRGPEVVADLNNPLPAELHRKYDLVIDTGTLEHCFNIGSAFRCMCDLVRLGGYVMTLGPFSTVNHGFWNFNPTAYWDGFTQNGFKLHVLQGVFKDEPGKVKVVDLLPTPVQRMSVPREGNLLCIAKRIADQEFAWPIQTKYKLMFGQSFAKAP